MKIRLKNTKVVPNTQNKIIIFLCTYPLIFVIIWVAFLLLGSWFLIYINNFEAWKIDSIYLWKLKIIYDMFGKTGIWIFFLIISLGYFYLFKIFWIENKTLKK